MDCFLRRIAQPDHIKKGRLSKRAFMCRSEEPSLSFTLIAPEVARRNFEAYHAAPWLASGDKPALCFLREDQFETAGNPRPVPDPICGEDFGDLHHAAPCPNDKAIAENLAYHATQNGMIRPLISLNKGIIGWEPPVVAPPFQAWTA